MSRGETIRILIIIEHNNGPDIGLKPNSRQFDRSPLYNNDVIVTFLIKVSGLRSCISLYIPMICVRTTVAEMIIVIL